MAYVLAFLDVAIDHRRDHPDWFIDIDSRRVTLKGHAFVDVRQPDGSYLRHSLAADQTLVTAPIPTDEAARYAVSYLPRGDSDDRMHWVAGALVRVTDTRSGQLLGELEAYAHQPRHAGAAATDRSAVGTGPGHAQPTTMCRGTRCACSPNTCYSARGNHGCGSIALGAIVKSGLEGGVLAHSFMRLHCGECGHDKPLAFKYKRREIASHAARDAPCRPRRSYSIEC
jgi:hypothetical protein